MEKIIYNARIITMNPEMDIIGHGYIRIKNGKITEIGPTDALNIGAESQTEYTDAQGMYLMPGFVNTHTHLPMTMLRGFADDLPLHQWLTEHIFPAEARLVTPDNVRIATRLALIEMIKSGTTCFNDMYFYEDIIAEEARKAGVRGVMNESLIDFPTASFQTPDEGLLLSEQLIQKWENDPIIHPSVCTHSPYTCSTATLQKAKKLADKYHTLLQIHVSETRKEVEDITARYEMPPGEYLHSIGLLDSNVIAAHGVWLESDRNRIVRRNRNLHRTLPEKQPQTGKRNSRHRHLFKSRNYRRSGNRRHSQQQHPRYGRRNALRRPTA